MLNALLHFDFIISLIGHISRIGKSGLSGLFFLVSLLQSCLQHPFSDAAVFDKSDFQTGDLPVKQIVALVNQTNHYIGKSSS